MGTIFHAGFMRFAWKYWKTGIKELYRSYSKPAFVSSLKELVPNINSKDLVKGKSGVRAQAFNKKRGLIDDFVVVEHKKFIHVVNSPSPAATASLAIGEKVAQMVSKKLQ